MERNGRGKGNEGTSNEGNEGSENIGRVITGVKSEARYGLAPHSSAGTTEDTEKTFGDDLFEEHLACLDRNETQCLYFIHSLTTTLAFTVE